MLQSHSDTKQIAKLMGGKSVGLGIGIIGLRLMVWLMVDHSHTQNLSYNRLATRGSGEIQNRRQKNLIPVKQSVVDGVPLLFFLLFTPDQCGRHYGNV